MQMTHRFFVLCFSTFVPMENGIDLVGPGLALVEIADLGHVQDDVVCAVVGVVLDHVGCLTFADQGVL